MNERNFHSFPSEWATGRDIEQLVEHGRRLHDRAIYENCGRLLKSLRGLKKITDTQVGEKRINQH